MKGHGGWPAKDWPQGIQYFRVAVLGAGAAIPVTPTNGIIQPAFPKKANALSTLAAEAPTRSGAGAYVITYDASFAVNAVLQCDVNVFGTVGAWGAISSVVASTRKITVQFYNAAGSPTDLATTDLAVFTLECADTNSIFP
jgi:hypothetical protein